MQKEVARSNAAGSNLIKDLPPGISVLSTEARVKSHARFLALASERQAPVPLYPQQSVWWPQRLLARALPEGIVPLDVEDGFDDLTKLAKFFSRYGDGLVHIGELGSSAPYFRFCGNYSRQLCEWIKLNLMSSPTCLLSPAFDLLLIADEQLRYSVIGGTEEIIGTLEYEWGGASELRRSFESYIERGDLGFDMNDKQWAKKYLVSWSGWH